MGGHQLPVEYHAAKVGVKPRAVGSIGERGTDTGTADGYCRRVRDDGSGLSANHALPLVPGLTDGSNNDLLGILISHPHADHYGLIEYAHPSLPVYIGKDADRLLRAAMAFGPFGAALNNVRHYQDRCPFAVGPFRITPYLADHSAFDAYSFLVEANGQSLFYSGDLRGHGWKDWAFKSLLDKPPRSVDMMLLEGTTLGRNGHESETRESDLVPELSDKIQHTSGIVLAAFSGQNIDRFVTFYKAARKAGRIFVADLYIAELLRAIDRKSLPDPTSGALRVYLPLQDQAEDRQGKAVRFGRAVQISAYLS